MDIMTLLRDKMTVLGLLVHVTSYYDLLSEFINLALCWPRDTQPKLQTMVNKILPENTWGWLKETSKRRQKSRKQACNV